VPQARSGTGALLDQGGNGLIPGAVFRDHVDHAEMRISSAL